MLTADKIIRTASEVQVVVELSRGATLWRIEVSTSTGQKQMPDLPHMVDGQYHLSVPVTVDIPIGNALSLPAGKPKVIVRAIDSLGNCRQREIELTASPPRVFAVLVGINNFANFQSPLKYARYDAVAVRDYLVQKRLVPPSNITLLTDEPASDEVPVTGRRMDATMRKFEIALADLADNPEVGEDSVTLIFLSTHGYYVDDQDHDDRQYLLFEDSTTRLDDSMLGKIRLEKAMRRIHSKTKIVLLDACYSGFVLGDKSDADSGAKIIVGLDTASSKAVLIPPDYVKGAYELASSTGTQKSWELPEKKQGAFTYFLLRAASDAEPIDHMITLRAVYDYMKRELTPVVQISRKALQEVDQHLDGDADKFVWAFR